jgi:hypothetical protein
VVWQARIDLLAVFRPVAPPKIALGVGYFLTAMIVPGGSKGAMVLFQDVLGFTKEARQRRLELRAGGSLSSGTPQPSADPAAPAPRPAAEAGAAAPWWRNPPSQR